MAIPQRVRDAGAEADQMLQQLAAAPPAAPAPEPAPAPAPPAPPAPSSPDAPPAAANPPVTPAPAPAPSAQPTNPETELQRLHQQLQSEQGRRAANEAETLELRGRLQQVTEQLAAMQRANPAPAAPAPAPVNLITDQDKADFGEDMIDFVGRVVKQAYGATIDGLLRRIGTLEGQLRQVGQQAQTAQQSSEEIAAQRYFQRLDELVPNWQAINDDPAFVDWLKNRDTFSRKTRHELLKSAHAEADAETVAAFFNAYLREKGTPAAAPAPAPTPVPPAPSVDPATLVAPTPSNAPAPSVNPRNGKIWTQAEIEQVYDDRIKKRITPEKFAEQEAEIQRALLEGRVQ